MPRSASGGSVASKPDHVRSRSPPRQLRPRHRASAVTRRPPGRMRRRCQRPRRTASSCTRWSSGDADREPREVGVAAHDQAAVLARSAPRPRRAARARCRACRAGRPSAGSLGVAAEGVVAVPAAAAPQRRGRAPCAPARSAAPRSARRCGRAGPGATSAGRSPAASANSDGGRRRTAACTCSANSGAVGWLGVGEQVEVQPQVVAHEPLVVPAAQAPGAVLGQVGAHVLDRREPVDQRAHLQPLLGDRGSPSVADPPVVDGLGEHVDRRWPCTCAGSVTGMSSCSTPSGKRKPLSSQKSRRNSLFHAVRSASSGRKRLTCVLQAGARERLGQERRLRRCARRVRRSTLPLAKSEPVSVERAREVLVGLGRDDVVGVGEREQLAGGGGDAGVARVAEARVGLADRRKRGSRSAKRSAISALASVEPSSTMTISRSDDGLRGQRPQAVREVRLDVVDRHDDADPRHAPMLGSNGPRPCWRPVANLRPFCDREPPSDADRAPQLAPQRDVGVRGRAARERRRRPARAARPSARPTLADGIAVPRPPAASSAATRELAVQVLAAVDHREEREHRPAPAAAPSARKRLQLLERAHRQRRGHERDEQQVGGAEHALRHERDRRRAVEDREVVVVRRAAPSTRAQPLAAAACACRARCRGGGRRSPRAAGRGPRRRCPSSRRAARACRGSAACRRP